MTVSLPIPQDIVYEIIDKLDNDLNTLKACARVARSFLVPSRKKIFSTVRLTTGGARRLFSLLQQNPDITDYILDVTIVSPFLEDATLLNVLVLLRCLRHFTIDLPVYQSFSIYLPAFRNLLFSPNYTTLTINGKIIIPSSLINKLRVKKLGLHEVMVRNSSTAEEEEEARDSGEPSMLETLDLLVWSVPDQRLEPLRLFRNVFGLRELNVRMKWGYEKTLSLGRDLIARSAHSIEHIALYYDSRGYITPDLPLGSILTLRYLSFSLQYLCFENEKPEKFKFDWESILDIISDPHTTRNLEELTLVIEFLHDEMNSEVMSGLRSWSDLNSIFLSAAPKLRKINLFMDRGNLDDFMGDEWLQTSFCDKFSPLREKGVAISCRSCNSSILDLRRW